MPPKKQTRYAKPGPASGKKPQRPAKGRTKKLSNVSGEGTAVKTRNVKGTKVPLDKNGKVPGWAVQNVQKSRTPQARNTDRIKTAKKVFKQPLTAEEYERWKKYPNKYDVENVDTPWTKNTLFIISTPRAKSSNTKRSAKSNEKKGKTAHSKVLNETTGKKRTSYSKDIIHKNQKHILDRFKDYDPDLTPEEAFVEQIDYIKKGSRMSTQQAIKTWAGGGSALIWNEDIKNYLSKDLKIPAKREYDDMESFELYCNLLARDGAKLYDKVKKGGKV